MTLDEELEIARRRLTTALIVRELERRDEASGIRYPKMPERECCFEGCPKCTLEGA